jgi:hypothetical protein
VFAEWNVAHHLTFVPARRYIVPTSWWIGRKKLSLNRKRTRTIFCSDGAFQRVTVDPTEQVAEHGCASGAVKKKVVPLEDLHKQGRCDGALIA